MPENGLNGDHVVDGGVPHDNEEENVENDVHFEPIISLPIIEVSNNEEDEVELIKLRAKLYRYDSSDGLSKWKERGTGEVKLLRHKTKSTVRVVMRRDKTLKICANHFVTPWMELKPNCGSDRAWVWSVLADFADEELKPELLAIRFANAENATMWKDAFEKAKKIVGSECEIYAGKTGVDEQKDDSSSEASYSDVSYCESSDNENQTRESKEVQEDKKDKPEVAEKEDHVEKVSNEAKSEEEAKEVEGQLAKLSVKNIDQDK
ncbi:ran-specific GTPase-activating protein [Neodiprion pinetum]|uniref:Ran-specific GTPase-activating protein n=1 Tax=Neodiprion lecontei TaxID=441921 RepID=A0ABM3FUG1_NEOLC|nr:ran-specific GTPase-activating protein-like [Neodiprion fabricii]XP_046415357.1 ran-specific GTPase-activating protein-like [Neodiprion fabricii]XP_046415358.1 ran-specific GTPase-activating protein-like [Neodiprion fabricii]XP_046474141.1 ran-specific GTPase-activating protein-like [Neodiprion pinetum]XP_046474142.1 ran-specific GTPase-activating protein-like [Neodiprion pinetum]XP_046591655.1 ran-specific GTPase-activating protein [Neodiprion lecontei]XP_046591656.1 ran-specific GTPase-a